MKIQAYIDFKTAIEFNAESYINGKLCDGEDDETIQLESFDWMDDEECSELIGDNVRLLAIIERHSSLNGPDAIKYYFADMVCSLFDKVKAEWNKDEYDKIYKELTT
jgi:hypothetical protein